MHIIKNINSCNLFIGLYSAYMFLKARESDALSGYLLLLITIISLGYFIYTLVKYKQPKMLKWLSILFFMFVFYGIVYIFLGDVVYDYNGAVRKVDYLKKIASSLLPVYPFFVFAKKGQFKLSFINFWLPMFIVISIYSFYQYYFNMLSKAFEAGAAVAEFTNNMGYLFVSLLPLIFIKRGSKLLTYIYMGVCALFIVMSVKRGAIIIGGTCILYYLFKSFNFKKGGLNFKYIFLLFICLLVSGYYIAEFISNSEYFTKRLSTTLEGNTSGRGGIYSQLWAVFINSDILNIFFGHGADSTIYYTNSYAHNDWLEILINQGIFGGIIYSCYFIVFYREWRRYRTDRTIGLCLSGLFIVLFLKTLFSMSYTEYTLFICMAYGYCMAYIQEKNSQLKRLHVG